jgi:hypothetical protein
MRPATADFGDSPPGAFRDFTLVAQSRATTDTLTTTLTGPNAGEFTVSAKACYAVGTPECRLQVMFIPTSYGRKVATLTVSGPGGRIGSATLTGNAVFGCVPLHVPCNYAANYSGTVVWSENLDHANPTGRTDKRSVRGLVTITAGRARCSGPVLEDEVVPREVEHHLNASLAGDGFAIVEFGTGTDDDADQAWYSITVVCPSPGGTSTSKNLQTGETSSGTVESTPAKMGFGEVSTYKQAENNGRRLVLKGSYADQHPDADPDNFTTGVFSMSWSLSRIDQPPPGPPPPPPPPPPPEGARDRSRTDPR